MSSRIPTCDVDKTFIWLIWVVPWWNCQLVITILTINNSLISLHVCRRWNILLTWFNHWSSVNKCVAVSICVVPHCSFIVSWNRRWIQNIDFSYCWTVIGNNFTNTFYVVVLTCTLKFCKFSTYSATKFTRHCWSISLLIQDITIKWTWIWCSVVLTLNTCLRIWSKFCFITSWFVTLSSCICCWTWRIISWWSCINYFIVSCLVHLSWWYANFNVWFAFSLVSWCQVVIHLFSRFGEWNISVVFNNDIHTCRTTISWCIIYKVWIISLRWKVSKIYFFTSVGWRQSCTCNFTSCILIYQTYINIRIVWAICLINWQSHIIICVVVLVIWFKIPNTKCQTIGCWISCISRRNWCWFISKCSTISIIHAWSCTNTRWICAWCSNSIQLCSNCCNTVNYWVTSETVVCDLSQHVINSVTKTFTLFCISSVCCWCSKQCCWFSDFFLNCCDSCLDLSFSSCVC